MLHQKFEEQPDHSALGIMSVGLQVADVAVAREILESRGVVFEGETVAVGGMRIAFTSDPDGVPIYILQTSFFGGS